MAETIPSAFDKAVTDAGVNGLDQPILHIVNDRSRLCARLLEAPACHEGDVKRRRNG